MDFELEFINWLNASMIENIPKTVQGFHFNLFEPANEPNVNFGIDLIGSNSFNNDDPDWPCNEIWEPEQRYLLIPATYTGDDWYECLKRMKVLIGRCLETDSESIRKLKSVKGIGLGFVDGDIEILWNSI
jgi:hypothetical protein